VSRRATTNPTSRYPALVAFAMILEWL
jgi:hypothetical protein